MDRNTIPITELTDIILEQLKASGFKKTTIRVYKTNLRRLCRLARERGEENYTKELGVLFKNDFSHINPANGKRTKREQKALLARCVQFVESFLATGVIDYAIARRSGSFFIKSEELQASFAVFIEELNTRGLKPNTIDGYQRFTYYFIVFLESKGYSNLKDIRPGDVVTFITVICPKRYQSTSLGAHISGLKIFLGMNPCTKRLIIEIPEHLPKKRDILKVYTDEEFDKILNYTEISGDISYRDKVIAILAFNTGLRAVDICSLRLSDIDWRHDLINITQHKTGQSHTFPLTRTIGNALVEYLLNERPVSDSSYVFLSSLAPYSPLISHAGIREILFNIVNDSDIESHGRIYGTRITRHTIASRMLRKGIPFPVISEMLGHRDKNSTMIYITTDDEKLAECTLPLPGKGVCPL